MAPGRGNFGNKRRADNWHDGNNFKRRNYEDNAESDHQVKREAVETYGEDHAGVHVEEGQFGIRAVRGEFPRELVTYLKEMKNLIKNDPDVDASLLMTQIRNNVNEEEYRLCLFQESSRLLEDLFTSPEDAIHLLSQVLRRKKHVLSEILFDGCGSRVLQTMFTVIAGRSEDIVEIVTRFVDLVAENYDDAVVSRTASFVIRSLGSTCVMTPFEARRNYRSCLTNKIAKAPKLDAALRQQFERLSHLVFNYASMKDYMDNNCISLVMQDFAYYDTIAKTGISNQFVMDFLQNSEEEFVSSLKSGNASRVWDVLMTTIKDDLRVNIYDLALSNHLYNIAKDDRARYCIEMFISSTKDQQLIENIVEELGDNINQLLTHRREVIVSAMLNAVSRHKDKEIQQRVFEPTWEFYGEDVRHVLAGKPASDSSPLGPETWNLTGIIMTENMLKLASTPLQKQIEQMGVDELIAMADHPKARFVLEVYFDQKHIEEKDKVEFMMKFKGRLVDLLSLRNTGAVFRNFWRLPLSSKDAYQLKYDIMKELTSNFGSCHTKSWRSVMEELQVTSFRTNETDWLKKNSFPKELYKNDFQGTGKHGKGKKRHFSRKMTEATLLLRPDEDEERQQQLPDFAAFEKKILNTWRQNPSTSYASVVEDIDLLFKRSQSPSMVFLELCERASLAIMNKTASSLHMAVVKYYVRWVDANPENRANHAMYLDRTVQDKAASLMFKLAPTLMSYFDELYTFDNLSKSMQEHAQEFLRIGAYLTAFHIIMHYKLFENFQMNQILPPLLLKKECGRVEEYLRDKPVMQREFTQWMDSLMILRYDELTRIVNVYVDIPLSAVDAISGKTLEKQIWRNFGRYNLSLADIPNSKKQRSEAALRHVHYELCNMNQLDYGQYLDHVKYALETNKSLQLYYVKLLLGYGDIKEASRWANFCNFSTRLVKNSDLRKRLRLDTPDALAFPNYVKDVDTAIRRTSPTGPYGLESFTVDFVGSMQKLKLLTERLRATKDTIIALDAEFRPMYIACVEKVALLQVAFDNCVFLVDTLSLEENDEEKQALWKDFFETLFTTEDNLKIGFAFSGDVKVISSSSPHLADLGQRMKLVGCMSKLVLAMYEKNPRSVPPLPLNPDGKPQFKLADLMYGVTNRQMDKKEQLSNWDRRPLRKEQMDYAAMDVISLMHIYSNLQRSASEHGVDFSECEKECILHVSATPKRPAVKKRKGKADQEAFYNLVDAMGSLNVDEQAKTVDDMKFICDSMLLGVGKDLRKCGIDAMLCSNRCEIDELMRSDGTRVIISSGKSYQRLVSAYPGNVLSLETGQQSLAAVETILKKYNIRVTVDDLFSRCQKCNYKCFVFVPYLVMIWMMKLTDKSLKPEERVEMIETFTTIEASDESGGYEARLVYKDAESAVFQMDSGYVDAGKAHVSLPHQPQEVVKVKIGALIPAVITEDKKFFRICGFCGKVYWDGGHLTNYQDVMNDSGLLHVEESEAAESEVAMTSQ